MLPKPYSPAQLKLVCRQKPVPSLPRSWPKPTVPDSENFAQCVHSRKTTFFEKKSTTHAPQITKATSTQDLDPLPLASNDYPSVLPHEMYALEPGDIPSRILSWKALEFLSHVKRRSNDD